MALVLDTSLSSDNSSVYFYNTLPPGSAFNVSEAEMTAPSNITARAISKSMAIPATMFFFGVFGNVFALVILTIRPSKDSKSTAFYHLVKALVAMDLFGIVASSPVTILVYIKGGIVKTGGMVLCHYISFLMVMAGNATLFLVLVMAVERFMVTKYPFQYSRIVTPTAVNVTIVLLWTLSVVIAVLPIIGLGRNVDHFPGTWCFFDYRDGNIGGRVFSFFYASIGLLVIFVTIILNINVIRHVWHMRRTRLTTSSFRSSVRTSTGQAAASSAGPDSESRMLIFLLAIILVFTLCYTPLMVRVIMNQVWNAGREMKKGGVDDAIDLWAFRLACINQILDPWVYIISRVTCCSGRRDSSTQNSPTHGSRKSHANGPTQRSLSRRLQRVKEVFTIRLGPRQKDRTSMPLNSDPKSLSLHSAEKCTEFESSTTETSLIQNGRERGNGDSI